MTLTAREAMQALLNGMVVFHQTKTDYLEYKLVDGNIVARRPSEGLRWSNPVCSAPLNKMTGIAKEFPLTFEEAVKAMLDGKVVENGIKVGRYRFSKRFEYNRVGDNWQPWVMDVFHYNTTWKVVE